MFEILVLNIFSCLVGVRGEDRSFTIRLTISEPNLCHGIADSNTPFCVVRVCHEFEVPHSSGLICPNLYAVKVINVKLVRRDECVTTIYMRDTAALWFVINCDLFWGPK